jgi:excisionase family DNA binding protein
MDKKWQSPYELIFNRLDRIESLVYSIKDDQSERTDTKEADGELLTIDQAAAFLHLSKATIYSKCSRNELPYMKRGKRLYFLKVQLLEYVKAGQHETSQQLTDNAHESLGKRKGGKS